MNLTPYDTGEVLEPHRWRPDREDRADFGKVDFDNDESATEFTIQVVLNDPLPESGERYTIRIINHSGDPYIVQKEG